MADSIIVSNPATDSTVITLGIQGPAGPKGEQGIPGTGGTGSGGVTVSETQPLTGTEGALWWKPSTNLLYVYYTTWQLAAIKGDTGNTGATGSQGTNGASAYDIAVSHGFVGTEVNWLTSLQGATGAQGIQGIQGVQGDKGDTGATGTVDTSNFYTKTDVDTALSGKASATTNTGDETTATIKSKLGIVTLSGSNTGDQTLAGLGGLAASDLGALTVPIKLTDTLTAGSGTLSGTLLDLNQTWGTTANPTAIKLNVTGSAGSTAKLMDLQVGGVSLFNVRKDGTIVGTGINIAGNIMGGDGQNRLDIGATNSLRIGICSAGVIGWTSNTGSSHISLNDLYIARDAANTLAQRNGANSQTSRIYNTYTDASNYVRTSLSSVTYSGAVYSVLAAESAGTGAANISIALSPKGTGAITAQVPDGTTAGGNARGANAIDLQTLRNGNDRVASGQYAVAIGYNNKSTNVGSSAIGFGNTSTGSGGVAYGINNTAANDYSVAIGASNTVSNSSTGIGQNNTVTGFASTALGQSITANKANQVAFGISSAGNQLSFLGLLGSTTDATPLELLCGGQANARATIPTNTTWAADVDVVARSASGTDNAYFKQRVLIKKAGAGSTVIVVGPTIVAADKSAGASTWDITCSADATNDALKITATGAAATTIRWVAKVSLVEVLQA